MPTKTRNEIKTLPQQIHYLVVKEKSHLSIAATVTSVLWREYKQKTPIGEKHTVWKATF